MKDFFVPTNTQTWPKSQTPPKIIHDTQNIVLVASMVAAMKQATQKNDYDKVFELVETFQNTLALPQNIENQQQPRPSFARLSTISEEPHFDSMILSEAISSPTVRTKTSISYIQTRSESGNVISLPVIVQEQVESLEEDEPLWINIVPHICLTFLCILYMSLGALMFKYLDPHIEKHPYHTCLLLSFQICFTIDWGNLPEEAELTKLLCIPFATLGIPLTFATLSNYGRFLAHGYCIYGFFSNSKPKINLEQQRKQIPIRSAFNLLVIHQLIGIVLFNTVYGKLGAVKAWYFIWSTITMISLGEIPFHPANLWQTIVIMLYFAVGNIIIQAILISICYQIQSIFLIHLKFYLFKFHSILKSKL